MHKSKVGIYVRISANRRNNTERGYESIKNQTSRLSTIVTEKSDMELVQIYSDEGYSGVNFNRPGFKRMLEDIESGLIDTIVMKDLSRLGRNYIGVGIYMQNIFPEKNIRLIAIDDSYDSSIYLKNGLAPIYALKTLLDDAYARDISIRIRSERNCKSKMGMYVESHVSYCYMRMESDKYRLIIDKKVAEIIRDIFKCKIEKKSCAEIADKLNTRNILSPKEYKKQNNINYYTPFQIYEKAKWYPSTVERIIKNRIYIGCVEQGKSRKLNYISDKIIRVPEEEWDIKENMHEPIVSEEVFKAANKELREATKKPDSLYGGILFCGDCGQPMVRRINKWKEKETIYYICSTNNKGKGCSRHSIKEEEIERVTNNQLFSYIKIWESKVIEIIKHDM